MIKSPAYVHFLQAGLMTSVQDWARFQMVDLGVPYSGVMDRLSMVLVNYLLQNPQNAAVLEMSQTGPEMLFEMPTRIAFAGAIADIYHNDKPVKMGTIVDIDEGDRVVVKKFRRRQWLYMGIQGGFETDLVGGSRSWFKGITPQAKVEKGDNLCYLHEERYFPPAPANSRIKDSWYRQSEIMVHPGPEWEMLPKLSKNRIIHKSFTISESVNRMAYQLVEPIDNDLKSILTAAVYPGTVQLTSGGNLIVLMRDAQVTGGYPRILQVENNSLSILSQKRTGDKIKFSFVKEELT